MIETIDPREEFILFDLVIVPGKTLLLLSSWQKTLTIEYLCLKELQIYIYTYIYTHSAVLE